MIRKTTKRDGNIEMKFYIAEQNMGGDTTKEQAERVIEMLREKGWDVEYGVGKNRATDVSEFGREEAIQDAFGQEFMNCIALIEPD
jgi:hypothetical protein